uniref:Uncharacterized protein n=1 Tax=Picea glauca TaxID=3330 RepID=A0A101LW51_PICGL|nr:hypothetical protein ABT39_MTgene1536 [Picea glauca]
MSQQFNPPSSREKSIPSMLYHHFTHHVLIFCSTMYHDFVHSHRCNMHIYEARLQTPQPRPKMEKAKLYLHSEKIAGISGDLRKPDSAIFFS